MDFIERRSGQERRSGIDRRGPTVVGIPVEALIDRLLNEADRRLTVLERHDERLNDERQLYLTREHYDERHQELVRTLENVERYKADTATLTAIDLRVTALEDGKHQEDAIRRKREESRQRMILLAGALGATVTAALTLILRAFGVHI